MDTNLVGPVWQVEALCRALADTLNARFNPVRVVGELSGFARAASGHCYFSLKDRNSQLRCAMFKRAAAGVDFVPKDGEMVEVTARIDLYGPRGDLQLIVEEMRQQGKGALLEDFLRLKAKLADMGLFDTARKRPLPAMPRGIGLVTSLGAAALHDVATALRRRAPHVPVFLAPAAVQGESAAEQLVRSLQLLMSRANDIDGKGTPLDVIALVRGGGSMEDLWSFNDERLAMAISASPVPVVSGVGHETDFTIADFVADVRAPTPTAAAEMMARPAADCAGAAMAMGQRMASATQRILDVQAQRQDRLVASAARPSSLVASHRLRLQQVHHHLREVTSSRLQAEFARMQFQHQHWPAMRDAGLQAARQRLQHAELRLDLLDPRLALKRGYAWLTDAHGGAISSAHGLKPGQEVRAALADGTVDLVVRASSLN